MQNSLTKKLGLTVAAVAMAATGLFTTTDAEAVPAFARQTGMTCNSCHFQSFPALNGMGRSFRAGGYTMPGAQTLIEGENMSLPSSLNIGAIWKTILDTTAAADGTPGELAWPDEAALLVGGRASASVGFLWEVGLNESPNFLSSKIHFNITEGETAFAIIPFATDAAGAAYGQELLNTSAQKSQRVIESRKAMSTGQITGAAYGAATGIAFVVSNPSYMVNFSRWAPAVANEGANVELGEMLNHIRVNYFMDIAGFDAGFGLTSQSGDAKFYSAGAAASGTCTTLTEAGGCVGFTQTVAAGTGSKSKTTADLTALDFQMQGQVGGNDLGIYFNYLMAGEKDHNSTTTSESGMGLTVKYSVTPAVQVFFATSSGSKKTTIGGATSSIGYTTLGVQYMVAENVKLNLYNESNTAPGGSAHTKLGWFVAL